VKLRIADCGLRISASSFRKRARLFRNPQSAIRNLVVATLTGCGSPQSAGDPLLVTIPRGATFDAAIDSLTARGVIGSPNLFGLYARLRGLPGDLKSGIYAFKPDDEWSVVVDALKRGRGVEVRFTLREGLTLVEAAGLAQAELGVSRNSFLAAAGAAERLEGLSIADRATTVEGYLFPTTYTLPKGIDAEDLVRLMTREFLAHWRPEWDARLDTLRWTRHQAVTLASIIEAETRYLPDAPFVSAVYHNRLTRRMPLQADPTVAYAHGRRLRRVYEGHLRVRSPYNTYLHPGLPPGPISQPGDESLRAALYPAPVPYLYFVAQPDGKHVFSMTYAEHLRAIREIRRGWGRRRVGTRD
jgi:UPF0755 protein